MIQPQTTPDHKLRHTILTWMNGYLRYVSWHRYISIIPISSDNNNQNITEQNMFLWVNLICIPGFNCQGVHMFSCWHFTVVAVGCNSELSKIHDGELSKNLHATLLMTLKPIEKDTFVTWVIGIDHDTVCAGVVCAATLGTARVGRPSRGRLRPRRPAHECCAGSGSTNHDSADRMSGQFLFYHENETKHNDKSRDDQDDERHAESPWLTTPLWWWKRP